MIRMIISGGQSGVDRAALDFALRWGIPCGGWCPRGRLAEDGPLDFRYPLRETASASYPTRTEWNVRDSDATLILARGPLSGGTLLTLRLANRWRRARRVVDLERPETWAGAGRWLREGSIPVLNVAGPRESDNPGLHDQSLACLELLFGVGEAPRGVQSRSVIRAFGAPLNWLPETPAGRAWISAGDVAAAWPPSAPPRIQTSRTAPGDRGVR